MICPRCNSTNVNVHREYSNINTFGDSKRISYRPNIFFPAEIKKSSTQVNYKTVAFCQNCGNTWEVGSTVNSVALLGYLLIFILICLGLLYLSLKTLFGWESSKTKTDPNDPTVITTDKVIGRAEWATEYTTIEDFQWDVDSKGIVLGKYKKFKDADSVRLSDKYTINGEVYHIYKIDDSFHSTNINSIIIPEGVTEIVSYTFNGSSVEYLYLPSTLETFGGWDHFHYLDTLYYGGSEEEFNKKFNTGSFLEDVNIVFDVNPDEL